MKNLHLKLNSLVVFRNLLKDSVIEKMHYLFKIELNDEKFIDKYCEFIESLYSKNTDNLSEYILKATLEDENIYVRLFCKGCEIQKNIYQSVQRELIILDELSQFKFNTDVHLKLSLPKYETKPINLFKTYFEHIDKIHETGFGIFAKYNVFTIKNGMFTPVKHPDNQNINTLFAYEDERAKVMANTLALLQGKPAANVLLYGDAGTGKSSTIKAVANSLYSKGLRLIEVKKHQLFQIPDILDTLSNNPLKFILFIDDLSFTSHDDNFAALKAILEGSVSAKGKNLAVYATSNRRHLIKETFSQRNGDDVHLSETLQELMSLSARFGLAVNFSKPDKDNYILIVTSLAQLYKLEITQEQLIKKAEAFALRGHGRSPRSAKQFIEQLKAEI